MLMSYRDIQVDSDFCFWIQSCHVTRFLLFTFLHSALMLLVRWYEGYPACKNFCV